MKKLIASRSIQYMGRTYERGDTLPAHDAIMVAAWLKAATAAWTDDGETAVAAVAETARKSSVNDQVADTLRAMGVTIEDDTGKFVGGSSLLEQLHSIIGGSQEPHQDESKSHDDNTGIEAQHLNAGDLLTLKKADLEQLAKDLGVDIAKARNNNERTAIIATAQSKADRGGQ